MKPARSGMAGRAVPNSGFGLGAGCQAHNHVTLSPSTALRINSAKGHPHVGREILHLHYVPVQNDIIMGLTGYWSSKSPA